jgi:hypothetical protein
MRHKYMGQESCHDDALGMLDEFVGQWCVTVRYDDCYVTLQLIGIFQRCDKR